MTARAERKILLMDGRTESVALELPAHCSLVLVHSVEQLRAIEPSWRALEAENMAPAPVFQSFDWCMAWSESYIGTEKGSSTLQIVTGYDGSRLVFAMPLMVAPRMGLRALVWLTEPFGQYGDVLCAKGENPNLWLTAAMALIKRFRDIDIIHLRHVRADSILATCNSQDLLSARVPELAPFLDLTAYATETDYDARYTAQQRKRRKKIRKSVEQMGAVTFNELPPGSMADAAMQTAISEKAAWLADRGRINRVMSCPSHLKFLKLLSRRTGPVSVVISELAAGGKPVSWEIGFRLGKTHFAYITSHVNALTNLSPGRLHMDLSQRACLAAGMDRFDLMVPNDAHKESWSSAKVETNDFYLPLSATGAAYGHLYLRMIRPAARTVYYWLEPRILPWLSRNKAPSTPDQQAA